MSRSGLRGLALGTMLPAYPGMNPPDWAFRLVHDGLAGFALFGTNIRDLDQVASVTARLRSVRSDVIIATDEEGGDVTRLCYAQGSPYPGNAALGVVDDLELTRAVHHAIGIELAAVGINLDMAPAVDVNSVDDNPAIGTRSFGADPVRVSAHASAAVTGLQAAGVAACAKHFPGHGATSMDSHLDLPVVDASLETLWRRELPPFQAAIAAGVRAIMTAHIRIPALTGELAATFSADALTGLLRRDLGFTGVVVSDGLEMEGASGAVGVPEAAVRALIAGNDLLCFGGELSKSPHAEALIEATVDAVVAAVRAGRLTADRLAEASARNARLVPCPGAAALGVDPELGFGAARRALRLEGTLPPGLTNALIVQLESAAPVAVGDVPWGLIPHVRGIEAMRVSGAGLHPGGAVSPDGVAKFGGVAGAVAAAGVQGAGAVMVGAGAVDGGVLAGTGDGGGAGVLLDAGGRGGETATGALIELIAARASGRPVVIVSRDTHRHPWARALVEELGKRHPAVVLVEMGWPAPWRPPGTTAYLATYGAARANALAAVELLLAPST
jgi:beta-N-acetylhexosaminidase